ncbi:MAG: DUF4254 domain-containing protein [Terracidiphilus sp.]|jgi:hypothetical protein
MLSANEITNLHDQRTVAWHREPADPAEAAPATIPIPQSIQETTADWLDLVARQHRANFELWHIEDEARAPRATDAEMAEVKRRVDCTNQLRNDLAEEIDRVLLASLESQRLPNPAAPLNSESPGMIIDRLSILALKIYHTREEAERPDAPPGHAERNCERLAILEQQRADLAGCLGQLWRETLQGARRFKIYQQLKMYNDPSLNPAIYRKLPWQTDR